MGLKTQALVLMLQPKTLCSSVKFCPSFYYNVSVHCFVLINCVRSVYQKRQGRPSISTAPRSSHWLANNTTNRTNTRNVAVRKRTMILFICLLEGQASSRPLPQTTFNPGVPGGMAPSTGPGQLGVCVPRHVS